MSLNLNETAENKLTSCPDCGNLISRKAAICPKCGRMFRAIDVYKKGWALTIAGGIILSSIIVAILFAVFWFFILVLLAGAVGGGHK